MNMSQIRALKEVLARQADSLSASSPEEIAELMSKIGLQDRNLYQEMEMEYRFVECHEDVSQGADLMQLHSHTFYEMLYCCGGSLQYLLGDERYQIQRGDILIIPPGVGHRPLFLKEMNEPYSRCVVWMSEEFAKLMRSCLPDIANRPVHPRLIRPAKAARACLEEMFRSGCREAARREPGWQAMVTGNMMQLLVQLDRAMSDGQIHIQTSEPPELLDTMLAYIEDHLAEKLTLESVARHCLVSESTISHLFHRKMSVGFYRCVTQRRLIAAKACIQQGETMGTVSRMVGFPDYASFYRAFKREYGISPTQYRRIQNTPFQEEKGGQDQQDLRP